MVQPQDTDQTFCEDNFSFKQKKAQGKGETRLSRPSHEQVMSIVAFMEQHPALGLGQMRGMEGREESKKLWFQLTRIVNNIPGPTRPVKSWMKYWADKKSTVRAKVVSGGDPNNLSSNIEKKIWDLFLANDPERNEPRGVKQESHFADETMFDDAPEGDDDEGSGNDDGLALEEAVVLHPPDPEERQAVMMDKLVKAMAEQAEAMSRLAHASQVNAQAMEKLAEAAYIQSRAIDRLAATFEAVGANTRDVRAAIVDIDTTMKRYYNTAPT